MKKTREDANRLLSDGLTMDNAVKIALLNNRELQAAFEEIGIARADLVQAGLFTNPRLSAVFRFPLGGGGASVEAEGLVNMADFWRAPLRKKVAAAKLEEVMFRVSDEILKTQAEAKDAYIEYIAVSRMREETEKIRDQTKELKDHLLYRREFGLSRDLDTYLTEAEVLDADVELARIEKELHLARTRLNRILGLTPEQDNYEIDGSFSGEFRELPDTETLIAHALSNRPDVQVAKLRIEESKRILSSERKSIFGDFGIGAAYAREAGGTDFLGPGFDIRIPLFDQNQAQIAKAEFRLRLAEKELAAKTGRVREEVSSVLESLSLARRQVSMIRDQLLPVRRRAVEYAESYFNSMQLNMLYLLDSRRKVSDAQKRLLEALKDCFRKEVELERALGGAMP
ncbi:MAG: TolC family protein [Thermodesulfovibrionales bacterium]